MSLQTQLSIPDVGDIHSQSNPSSHTRLLEFDVSKRSNLGFEGFLIESSLQKITKISFKIL